MKPTLVKQDDIPTLVACPAHRAELPPPHACIWCRGTGFVSVDARARFKLGLQPLDSEPPPEAA